MQTFVLTLNGLQMDKINWNYQSKYILKENKNVYACFKYRICYVKDVSILICIGIRLLNYVGQELVNFAL